MVSRDLELIGVIYLYLIPYEVTTRDFFITNDGERRFMTILLLLNVITVRSLEESRLPFSKSVQHIYEKLRNQSDKNGGETTLAFVRSFVLFIGQHSSYNVSNTDADVLEDELESCLWCWEVRDFEATASD